MQFRFVIALAGAVSQCECLLQRGDRSIAQTGGGQSISEQGQKERQRKLCFASFIGRQSLRKLGESFLRLTLLDDRPAPQHLTDREIPFQSLLVSVLQNNLAQLSNLSYAVVKDVNKGRQVKV